MRCFFCFVWFLMSQSTAMVMSGWSVHLTTLFSWASLTKQLTSTSCTYFHLQLTTTLLESAEGRRMAVEIISRSISAKVWDQARIELATPGLAVGRVTGCATQPGKHEMVLFTFIILDTGKQVHWQTVKTLMRWFL